jgi:hypothetical protein
MPMWCLQENECLGCTGGCEGYETKREAMAEQRAAYWSAVSNLPANKEANAEFARLLEAGGVLQLTTETEDKQ